MSWFKKNNEQKTPPENAVAPSSTNTPEPFVPRFQIRFDCSADDLVRAVAILVRDGKRLGKWKAVDVLKEQLKAKGESWSEGLELPEEALVRGHEGFEAERGD